MQPSGKNWADPMNKTPIQGASSTPKPDGSSFPKATSIIALTQAGNEETKENKKKIHVG